MLTFTSIPNPSLALKAPVYSVASDGKVLPVRVTVHHDRYEVDMFDMGIWSGPIAETAIIDGRDALVTAINLALQGA
jgi:hypothetical protein